jgi:hypothetical protein
MAPTSLDHQKAAEPIPWVPTLFTMSRLPTMKAWEPPSALSVKTNMCAALTSPFKPNCVLWLSFLAAVLVLSSATPGYRGMFLTLMFGLTCTWCVPLCTILSDLSLFSKAMLEAVLSVSPHSCWAPASDRFFIRPSSNSS